MIYAFYGAGGFARETYSSFVEAKSMGGRDDFEIVFIDDDGREQGGRLHGSRVISYEEARGTPGLRINVALAEPKLRRRLTERAEQDGLKLFSSYAHTAIFGGNADIGPGAIFSHHSMVTADARIGKAFHCNIYSYVAHDCIVGDFVTFGPRVSLNGRIKVEDDVYVGSGATFLPGKPDKFLTIGRGAVIGAGAVVTRDVEPGVTMVGNPAKPKVLA